MNKIPIKNIFYLLSYALDYVKEVDSKIVSKIDGYDINELILKLILSETGKLLKQGLLKEYQDLEEESQVVRGKIMLGDTFKRCLHKEAKLKIQRDELSENILPNQIVKFFINKLYKQSKLLSKETTLTLMKLSNVDDIKISQNSFSFLGKYRLSKRYRFLISLCELVYHSDGVQEGEGNLNINFFADEARMPALFEKFVFNFYKLELDENNKVFRTVNKWFDSDMDRNDEFLPVLKTDIEVQNIENNSKTIIDTKFYKQTLVGQFDTLKVHSSHLQQIMSYLENNRRAGFAGRLDGILLYPSAQSDVGVFETAIWGYQVKVVNLDLTKNWKSIYDQMLRIIDNKKVKLGLAA